jgi:hypothetical protein
MANESAAIHSAAATTAMPCLKECNAIPIGLTDNLPGQF